MNYPQYQKRPCATTVLYMVPRVPTTPKLTLVSEAGSLALCTVCKGTGKQLNEDFQLRSGKWVRGGGYIPCPNCLGKKLLPASITTLVTNNDLEQPGV